MEIDSLVGFKFQPTNEEIILLLKKKRLDPDFSVRTVKEIDFYDFDPWDLPRHSEIQSKEPIWYFYSKPYYKYAKSKRAHRRTISGYWKITGRGSDMKAKNSKDVIGSKKILSFYLHDPVSKEAKPEWVMHEIHIKDNDPLYKEDFVVCRLERRRDNKPRISTSDEGESSQDLVVAENSSTKSVLPPNQQFVSNMNNIGEKTLDESKLLPNQHVAPNSRNHVAEKKFPEVEYQQPNQYLTSDYRNRVAENFFPMDESQLLPSHHLASHPRNHVVESTHPWVEYQTLPSHHLISDFRDQVAEHSLSAVRKMVEPLLPAQFDALYLCNGLNDDTLPALQSPINVDDMELTGSNGLDHNTFSALQSPIYPEQISSSYSDGFSNNFNVMNFQFDSKQEDMNLQLAFQDKYPPEETGQTLPPRFNSSKSITEVHLGDGNDTDIETVDGWVNGCSPIAAGDYYFDNIWEPQINYAGEYYY